MAHSFCSRAEARVSAARAGAIFALRACALLAAACATSPGRLESNRFQHEAYPYALFYPEGGRAEYPLGPHYKVENFYSPDGQHRYPRLGDEFSIDRTYRDESPAVVGSESFYDLLLSHDDPKARFWLRSVPLAKADASVPLATLAQRYLDAVTKTGRAAAPFGLEREAASNAAQVRNVQRSACALSKRQALRLDFELENPGAKRTLDEPEWRSVSVVLVETGYFARVHYPVVLLVGSQSDKAGDPALTRDFDRLLEQLALGDKGRGLTMKGGSTCGVAAVTAAQKATDAPAAGPATSGAERTPELEVPIIQEDGPDAGAP
jgi:hypothetical protein